MGGRASKVTVASGGPGTTSIDLKGATALVAEYKASKHRSSGRIAWDDHSPPCASSKRNSAGGFLVDQDSAREERQSPEDAWSPGSNGRKARHSTSTGGRDASVEVCFGIAAHRASAPSLSYAGQDDQSVLLSDFSESVKPGVSTLPAPKSIKVAQATQRTSATGTVAGPNTARVAPSPKAPAYVAGATAMPPAADATQAEQGAAAVPGKPVQPTTPQQPMPAPSGRCGEPSSPDSADTGDAVPWVVRPGPPIEGTYKLGKVLGQGSFGVVRAATHMVTGVEVAVKTIRKSLLRAADVSSLRREVEILHHLSGHPHISQLLGVFEEPQQLHLVLELYKGGDLFDAIIGNGRHSERTAADVMRTVLTAIAYCHAMGVAHRDIKPENFMLTADPAQQQQQQQQTGGAAKGPDGGKGAAGDKATLGARLKLIDFGLSAFCTDDTPLTEIVGTSYYVAPEVLEGHYSLPADVWSAGVILHIMLTGYAPFDGRDDKEILRAVRKGKLDLTADAVWKSISKEAAAVMLAMLERDPKKRATADQVLAMPWLGRTGDACTAPSTPLPGLVSERINAFARMSSFKKEARRVVAGLMRPEEVAGLVAQFRGLDSDRDGRLSMQELREGLARQAQLCGGGGAVAGALAAALDERQLREMLRRSDLNGDGMLDESEFLGAVLPATAITRQALAAAGASANGSCPAAANNNNNNNNNNNPFSRPTTTSSSSTTTSSASSNENAIAAAFRHFDVDGSGYITADELRRALAGHHHGGKGLDIKALLARHDRDADGRISYGEFLEMLVQDGDDEQDEQVGRAADGGGPRSRRDDKVGGAGGDCVGMSSTSAAASDARRRALSRVGTSTAWAPDTAGGGGDGGSGAARGVELCSRDSRRRAGSGVRMLRGDSANYGHSRSSTVAAQGPSGPGSPLDWSDECESEAECEASADVEGNSRYGTVACRKGSIVAVASDAAAPYSTIPGRSHCSGSNGGSPASASPRLQPQPPTHPQPPSQPPPARLSARCGSTSRYGTAAAAAAAAAGVLEGRRSVDYQSTQRDPPCSVSNGGQRHPYRNETEPGGISAHGGGPPAAAAAAAASRSRLYGRPAPPPLQVPVTAVADMRGRRHSTCGMLPESNRAGGANSPVLMVADPRAPMTPRAAAAPTISSGYAAATAAIRSTTQSGGASDFAASDCYAAAAAASPRAGLPGSPAAAHRGGAASRARATSICGAPPQTHPATAHRTPMQRPASPARQPAATACGYTPTQLQIPSPPGLPSLPTCGSSPETDGPVGQSSGSRPMGHIGGMTFGGCTSSSLSPAHSRARASGAGSPMASRHATPHGSQPLLSTHMSVHATTTSGCAASSCSPAAQRPTTPSAPLPLLMPSAAMRGRRQSTGSPGLSNPVSPTVTPLLQPVNPLSPRVSAPQQSVFLDAGMPSGGLGSPIAGRRSRRSTVLGLAGTNNGAGALDEPLLILTSRASLDFDASRGLLSGPDGYCCGLDSSMGDDDLAVLPPGATGYGSTSACGGGGGHGGGHGPSGGLGPGMGLAGTSAVSISARVLPPSFMGLKTSASGRM